MRLICDCLRIVSLLSGIKEADFLFLQREASPAATVIATKSRRVSSSCSMIVSSSGTDDIPFNVASRSMRPPAGLRARNRRDRGSDPARAALSGPQIHAPGSAGILHLKG